VDPSAECPLILLFLLPILACAYLGGLWPGLLATTLAALAFDYFRLPPLHSLWISEPPDRVEWALMWALGLAISLVLEARHRRWESAEDTRQRHRNVFARQLQVSAVQARMNRFQRFTRDAPIGVVFSSNDGSVHIANDEYLRIVGCSRDEFESGWGGRDRCTSLDWLRADHRARGEKEYVRRDGTRVPVLVGISGRRDGFAAFVIDLTSEKEAQRARRESEERFRTLADNMAQLAWMADEKGRISWFNKRWLDYTGATSEEMEAGGWRDAIHPEHVERVVEKLGRCFATGEVWEDTFPLRGRDGRYRWFLSRAVPIRDAEGNVLRWFGTKTDVTEQREAEEELKEADRRKSDFLGVLSHELRNPLASIQTSVYILEHAERNAEHARRATDVIGRQVGHLTRLVDDLLDITRIARGKIELRRARLDLSELVRRCGEDNRAMLQALRLELSVSVPGRAVWVDGDETRLTQVIGNLLHNAGKFSREGGAVTLALVTDAGAAEIHVRDTGAGIEPELLGRVFEPFVQAERTLAPDGAAVQLGLALVKGVTELHGGSVRASSPGLGKGAEFVVRLPTAEPSRGTERAASNGPPRTDRHARVLVVEDNRDVAESLGQLVVMLGHQVEIAHDGLAAIAKAHSNPPDVVLCDIGLPGMSGYDVARAFRADPALRGTHLVAVSGYAQPEDKREAAEAGFEQHVKKPADPDEIQRLLEV